MINRKSESGFFNPFALTVTAIAICLILAVRAMAALTPATATPDTWTTETYGGPGGYFPAQLLDRSREFELMPDLFE
jgi:hypothetical protein